MTREEAIDCINAIHVQMFNSGNSKWTEACDMAIEALKERLHDGWVKCSDRLPTAEDGERVVVHLCFEKPACEYVFVPWKTVRFEYEVGHIDAWFPIPTYKGTERDDEK